MNKSRIASSNPYKQPQPAPIRPAERIQFIDILRGFAVFGILVANMAHFSGFGGLDLQNDPLDRAIVILTLFLVQAKFYSLFSLLFGWGMAIQLERSVHKGVRFTPIFLRRLLILLGFGVLHGILIWSGDILTTYALLGLLLLLFRKRSEKTLLLFSALLLLFAIVLNLPGEIMQAFRAWYNELTVFMRSDRFPAGIYANGTYFEITLLRKQEYLNALSGFIYYLGNILAMFLLGLYIGKRRIFQDISAHLQLVRWVCLLGLVVGLIFNAIFVWTTLHPEIVPAGYSRFVSVGSRTIGAPALMLFYVAGIILLLQRESWQQRLGPLSYVGRMALTNYLFQSVIATLIFYGYGLGLYGRVSATFGLILTVVIYLVQIRLSQSWFEHHAYGPMEKLWRILTYRRWRPIQAGEHTTRESDQGVFSFWKMKLSRFRPVYVMLIVCIFLIIWGGLLVVWYLRLHEIAPSKTIQIIRKVTATPVVSINGEDTTLQKTESDAAAVTMPQFEPVAYSPSKMAASGDTEAFAAAFNVDHAIHQIETLTGPPYLGRRAGSPEGRAAAEYLARQFDRYGLRPAGENGTFFQEFDVLFTPLLDSPKISVETTAGVTDEQFQLHRDFSPIVRWYSGVGQARGEVYWVDGCTADDFMGLDVVDKVVLCLADSRPDWLLDSSRNAIEHGVAGLLFLSDPETYPPNFGYTFKEEWVPEPLPTYRVYPRLVQEMLMDSGLSVGDLFASVDPFPLGTRVAMDIETATSQTCPGPACIAQNVLGVLPGRDPDFADELVILGAHYDHLGQAPDGIFWPGANDNASGVAALLEIARNWRENGYVPRRTVLFAAWDAEEAGLLGSSYYVQNPQYPLDQTWAVINLDMVGASTEILSITGDEGLVEHLSSLAESSAIPVQTIQTSRSDHTPFLSAGVSAGTLIWFDDTVSTHYHLPSDSLQVINREKYRQIGETVELAMLDLVESEPAIKDMLAQRTAAIQQGDLAGFLETSNIDQHEIDQYWFEALRGFEIVDVLLEPKELEISGNLARTNMRIAIKYLDLQAETITQTLKSELPVQLVQQDGGWRWAGPDLAVVSSPQGTGDETKPVTNLPSFRVFAPDEKIERVQGLEKLAVEKYLSVTEKLGLPGQSETRVYLFPDVEMLQASISPRRIEARDHWISPGIIKLVYSDQITTSVALDQALTKLVLAENGLSESAAPWLWEGLPILFQEQRDLIGSQSRYLPILAQTFSGNSDDAAQAEAWAATSYLLQQVGWSGLGELISEWGAACSVGECQNQQAIDTIFREIVQTDQIGFESAWRSYWQARITRVQEGLDQLADERIEAIQRGDESAFLRTVAPQVPFLLEEQRHWFAGVQSLEPGKVTIQAQPLVFFENEDVLAKITLNIELGQSGLGEQPLRISNRVLLRLGETGYQWAGPALEDVASRWLTIRYPPGQENLAAELLESAESIYIQLADKLVVEPWRGLTISLYDDRQDLLASISPDQTNGDSLSAWTAENEGIKLLLNRNGDIGDYRPLIARQLGKNLLHQMGVSSGWLIAGVSSYLVQPIDRRSTTALGANLPSLLEAAVSTAGAGLPSNSNQAEIFPLTEILNPADLSSPQRKLFDTQAWDAVRYLVDQHGWGKLLDVLKLHGQGWSLSDAMRVELGTSLDEFEHAWRQSLKSGHASQEWAGFVKAFDVQSALGHVAMLTGPELGGRLAGSPGSEKAAGYIAEKFRTHGLEPIEYEQQYYQRFPISYTVMLSVPSLMLAMEDGRQSRAFNYREDFLVLFPGNGQLPTLNGELVWVGQAAEADIDLTGKIALQSSTGDMATNIARVNDLGAEALLIIGNKYAQEDLFAKRPITRVDLLRSEIPVIELSQVGSIDLLEFGGHSLKGIQDLSPGTSMGMQVRLTIPIQNLKEVISANVLGLVPGNDPVLAQEYIILGAHYDHVGDEPDRRYSGGNDDASGVAVLLEIARLWEEIGYQPKRSVLFAAWGAQEYGEVGSNYYVHHPVVPLENTIAVLQMDGVGGGEGFNLGVLGTWETDGMLFFALQAAEKMMQEKIVYTDGHGGSDQVPFHNAGLPAALLSWRLANEDNLPDELANGVHPRRLEVTGQIVALALMSLAQ